MQHDNTYSFVINGCVCMPKTSVDGRLVEEYLASSHCYLPSMWCCKLLENILDIITLLRMHDPLFFARAIIIIVTSEITSAESRVRFLTKSDLLFWLP